MCTKNTALGDVSRDKYSTRLHPMLYLSLDTPPCAVFSVQTHGSALSNVISLFKYRIAGKFGGENVWQIYSFQVFGGKKFGE